MRILPLMIAVIAAIVAAAGSVLMLRQPQSRPPVAPVNALPSQPAPLPPAPRPEKIATSETKPPVPRELTEKLGPFLEALWTDAQAQTISRATFDRAFAGLELDPDILDKLASQPELVQAAWDYVGIRVSETRIANGQAMLAQHSELLAEVERRHGIERHVLIAIWGMESNYGAMQGSNGIVRSLTTLAIGDPRRPQFWRSELLKALAILERGDIAPEKMTGSWAGAMGHMQFMPSSFLTHAVDHDGDGRRDIWTSIPDALASAGNYLAKARWRTGEPWGFEVALPDGFDFALAAPGVTRSAFEWLAAGIAAPPGRELPASQAPLSLLLPAGARGPAFLVTPNFRAILSYNNAVPYALAVGHLADRISGGPPIQGFWPTDDPPLDRGGREELQRRLAGLGHDVGSVDGVIGTQTRNAVRTFQIQAGLPPDGYAGQGLLRRLKEATAK